MSTFTHSGPPQIVDVIVEHIDGMVESRDRMDCTRIPSQYLDAAALHPPRTSALSQLFSLT